MKVIKKVKVVKKVKLVKKVVKQVKVVKKVKVRSCIGRPIQSGVRQGKWVKKVEVP